MSIEEFPSKAANIGKIGFEDLPPNQQKAIAALLEHTTITAAAKACGLSERTIRGYMDTEGFAEVLAQEKRALLDQTVLGLLGLSGKALKALDKALDTSDIRAIRAALEYIVRVVELDRRIIEQDELLRRIEELENE